MRKFKVMLHGKNLLLNGEGRVEKHGVYIVRFVEAIDELLAEHTALEGFRCESKGNTLMESWLNEPGDPPVFEAEEIAEVNSFDHYGNLKPGLVFYPENEKPDF